LRIEVKHRTVITDSETQYKKGSCEDVREDRKIDVTGLLQSDGRILAQLVEIHKK